MTLSLERKRIRISPGEMAYVDMGEGRPVVLLHGFPTSAHLWRRERSEHRPSRRGHDPHLVAERAK